MTAQAIIASDLPITVVLSVRTDNTKTIPASYNDWAGGKSMLALPMDVAVDDNSQLFLATGAVAGLTYNECVFGEFFIERSLQPPFEGGFNLDFGKVDVYVSGDDLELYARDWENKPFTIYVGYEGDDWSNFEIYATGKTLGHSLIDDGIQVDLSLNPTGTDKLFPVNRFDDGRVKPYLFGRGFYIKPVKVNPDADDGLWQVHSGTLTTSDYEYDGVPAAQYDGSADFVYGGLAYIASTSANPLLIQSATNSKPSDLSSSDASITAQDGFIQITAPDNPASIGYYAGVYLFSQFHDTPFVADSVTVKMSFDFALDFDSTVDSYDFVLGISPFDSSQDKTVNASKTIKTQSIVFSSQSLAPAWVELTKLAADSSEDVILNIYGIRIEPVLRSSSLSVITQENDRRYRLPTYRVADAKISASFPPFVAVYDDTGLIKIADNNENFLVTATGDSTNINLVSACQYISTQANGTDSPITSSITRPAVGIYCDTAKPIITWWREWCDPIDCYLEVDLNGNNTAIKRRYNNQVLDADGNVNSTDAFDFVEFDPADGVARRGEIINLKQYPNEPSVSQYEVSYRYRYATPQDSPTKTFINPFARLNEVRRIDTVLIDPDDAQVVAESNRRDGNKRSFYEFEVPGAGYGLKPNDTGRISHSKLKDGIFTLRFVREYPLTKKTLFKGVKNG